MATGKSGYIDVTVNPSSVGKVRVYWREDYDVEGNYSTITITDIQGYIHHREGSAIISLKVAVENATFMSSSRDWLFWASADTTFRSVVSAEDYETRFTPITSGKIYHNDDGTKSIDITCNLNECYVSAVGFQGSSSSAGSTVTLTSIPRASTISATDANIESVSSIAVNRKSSAYTHSVHYEFGTLSGYINADGGVSSSEVKLSETSIGFTIPTSFYAQIPNSKTGICTLTVKTYSGNTQIGDAKTCTFTVTAAQSKCMPAVLGTVVDVNETTLALTGDENKLVRFYSNALATITAEAKNSASIASKAIAGVEVSEDTRTIEAVETASFVFGAVDSRGYSNAATVTKMLIEYIKLTANMTVSRDDPTSGKATLIIKGDYFNGSFGAVDNALTVQFRIDNGDWVAITPTIDGNTYIAVAALTDLDYQSTFAFDVVAADKLMNVLKSDTLNKGIANVHMGEENVTFEVDVNVHGNTTIDGALSVGGDATIDGALTVGDTETTLVNLGAVPAIRKVNGKELSTDIEDTDYIVAQGTSGIWTYRKWNSGIAECWGYTPNKTVSMVTWGNGYESSETIADSVAYPFTFSKLPVVSATPKFSSYNWMLESNSAGTTTKSPNWYAMRPSNTNSVTGAVFLYVIGKWK